MMGTHTDGSHRFDLEHHLQAESRAFDANKSVLSDKSVSIAQRLACFDAMVTPVAGFASGHRIIYKHDLCKLDITFRKLVRAIVGPSWRLRLVCPMARHPAQVERTRFGMCLECAEQAGVKLWSRRCVEQHWKLANYIAKLSDNCWLKRALAWTALQDEGQGLEANKRMGCANTNALPMEKIRKREGNRNANRSFVDTYGLFRRIFDAEVVRVEIG